MAYRHARKLLSILAVAMLLVACGQTGPLVLPDDAANNADGPDTEQAPANANE
ncbi:MULTISPECIES: LPS translocon maturation chaperone LptM [Spongiibacter]|uniref:LPS translocon maturation chaperone LptM n=1 Tax=Spongiibacter TaxID=630749 RepID=UPI0003B6826C|nr:MULTISPECIES: lipoprotein [Spongiibacter]MAY38766.1 hypothetical protein [Spongiibacter sp.]MBI57120.1 hypothetical protein [Spongiibacter sp.]MBO6753831.1 lipoprotein [Spongiibacter sp.]|tara:strand:+ start:3174 stop:3332 length:159 start_codon:yes stop_codon:yes gene_type:complete